MLGLSSRYLPDGRGQFASIESKRWRTRFAPAPTGHLHLGHVVNALHVWGIARAFGGSVLLRIEDHDRTRSKREYEQSILDDLEWLGFLPDVNTVDELRSRTSGFRQSDNDARYQEALEQLQQAAHVYPCRCSRRDIASVVGHEDNVEMRYPGTCRNANVSATETAARRVELSPHVERFVDLRLGELAQDPSLQCGDLLLRDRLGSWTYQLSVVVDDMAHEVDVVIRGEDLLESTGRQIRLARMLGRKQPALFYHHPLVRHPDGTKLSKSNRDTAVRELRAAGCSPAQLRGMAAQASGLIERNREVELEEIAALFSAN